MKFSRIYNQQRATDYLLSLVVTSLPAFLAQQLAVFAFAAAVLTQHASPLLQQAAFAAQHALVAAVNLVPSAAPQQALPWSQQAWPFSQHPSLSVAAQQALPPSAQQAIFDLQQFFVAWGATSAAQTVAATTTPSARNPPARAKCNFDNMEYPPEYLWFLRKETTDVAW